MKDLIERLKKATGPSLDLDHEIADALEIGGHGVPLYTGSFDAALRLVPDGFDWIVGNVNGHVGGTPYACVGSTDEHFGETPILALCIAAIKAQQEFGVNASSTSK